MSLSRALEDAPPTVIWISWLAHTRTSEICEALGIPLHTISPTHPGWRRYPGLIRRTLRLLRTQRPRVLIVPNPSLVLTLLCTLLRPIMGYRLIVDAHNEAVEPFLHDSPPMRWLARRLLAAADTTIVTNRALAKIVKDAGGTPLVLPDRIPTPRATGSQPLSARFNVVLIATFAEDEPYAEVFDAVGTFGDRITLFVTGNPARLGQSARAELPAHIVFTGFLPDADYWRLLMSADAVIDLTRMENCLVCGAYEAVAVERPAILSDTAAIREHFHRGVIYARNSSADIRQALERMLVDHATLADEIRLLKQDLTQRWSTQADELRATLARLGDRRN